MRIYILSRELCNPRKEDLQRKPTPLNALAMLRYMYHAAITLVLAIGSSSGLLVPWVSSRQTCRLFDFGLLQATSPVDEYEAFALEFEQALRSSRWAGTADDDDKDADDELSPYYRRDRRTRNAKIADQDGLRHLLQVRHEARRCKNFDQVDQIDKQLKRNHGVKAYDRPPIWTLACEDPPQAHLRRWAEKRQTEMKNLHGPLGHPYRQVGNASPVDSGEHLGISISQVHTSLCRRMRCRMEGRYEEADAIRFELSLHGIRVADNRLEWTMDDDWEFSKAPPVATKVVSHHPERPQYRELPSDTTAADGVLRFGGRNVNEDRKRHRQRVNQLLEDRSEALLRSETQKAHLIALELHRTYQVSVDDAALTWWVHKSNSTQFSNEFPNDGNDLHDGREASSPTFPGILFGDEMAQFDSPETYRRSSLSLSLEDERWTPRVEHLLRDRIHKREEARYLEADALRRELWHTYHVGVNDRLQQYSVGGAYDNEEEPSSSLID